MTIQRTFLNVRLLAVLALLSTPFFSHASILGNIGYDRSFEATASLAAMQNLGNGSFSGGEKVTGVDIRIGGNGGNLLNIDLRSFLIDSSGAGSFSGPGYVNTTQGNNVYHFDFTTPFLPDTSKCYLLLFYQFFGTPATSTFYGWSTNQYTASTTGCHPQYASHNINAALQNPALNGHDMIDYSFLIHTEPVTSPQVPPTISNLQQFRQFGVDEIAEDATFVGNAAVFKADIADSDSAQVKLEIELKPIDMPFDGSNTTSSSLVSPGTLATENDELIPTAEHYNEGGNEKSFHWRARAVDTEGNTSDWLEPNSNPTADFTVKVVPLWTQRASAYPERTTLLTEWEQDPYAHADIKGFRCGTTIRTCGCSITSLVMLGHYYGIEQSITGGAITPRTINDWLKDDANHGYTKDLSLLNDPVKYERKNGGVIWDRGTAFLGGISGTRPSTFFSMDYGVKFGTPSIDTALQEGRPAIAYNAKAKHYLIIDSALNDAQGKTFTVRDPFWYETRSLNEPAAVPDRVYAYNNVFEDANLFTKLDTAKTASGGYISLASPAELIVTDPRGRRVGFDPRTNTSFNEIPEAAYYTEGEIGTTEIESSTHFNKVVQIPTMLLGQYHVAVIGTGTGDYTLSSLVFADDGSVDVESASASTTVGKESAYSLTFSSNAIEIDLFPSAPLLIETLRSKIQSSTIKSKTKISLLELLKTTEELIKAKKYKLARLSVDGMIALVTKERGKSIPVTLADELLELLRDLKKTIL